MVFVRLFTVAFLALLPAVAGAQTIPDWAIGAGLNGGVAGGEAPYFGYALQIDRRVMDVSVNLQFTDIQIRRECKTSMPPKCDIRTPAGRSITGGLAIPIYASTHFRMLVNAGAGVASWVNNAKDGRYLDGVGVAGMSVRFGSGDLYGSTGADVHYTPTVTTAGLNLSVGYRM